jgi:hypothetical protein
VSEEWEGVLGMRFDRTDSPLPDERTIFINDRGKEDN